MCVAYVLCSMCTCRVLLLDYTVYKDKAYIYTYLYDISASSMEEPLHITHSGFIICSIVFLV